MKYRIKVFPYKGRMRYMPQQKDTWSIFWQDVFNANSKGEYDNAVMYFIQSESSCSDFIARMKEQDREEQKKAMKIKADKKFASENPAYYIEVGDE